MSNSVERAESVERGGSGQTAAALLLTGVLLLAANLRPSIAVIGPLMSQIRTDLGLTGTETSLLASMPVLIFGVCAPMAPMLIRRLGTRLTTTAALGVVALGAMFRLAPGWPALLAGTCILSIGIAVGNVLLPVLTKSHFVSRVGSVTGLSTMTLNVAAAAAAATIVPLTVMSGGNWHQGLMVWALPAVIGVICWAFLTASHRATGLGQAADPPATGSSGIRWTGGAAVHIVIFTAAQSVVYYCMLAWLPSIFQSHGQPTTTSGILLSIMTVVGAPIALLMPVAAARMRDQRPLVAFAVSCAAAGLVGLLLFPGIVPVLWAVLLGIGQGASFSLALAFFSLKTKNSGQTAKLSMAAQSVAYVIAALGPFVLSLLHDRTGSWSPGVLLLLACLGVQTFSGLKAARAASI
ncbi:MULTISPECIES: MFS transporter [Arthrobacter]|uniref:MFS transporter n=2 Tax=Arthrobacter TaxID=1663 RepID=A0ABU9KN12_9MICC|nr:MFS transporter [Arthrobacter sp. YJM1]MDP5228242.1 MFS transporter [Arthrobacter sp. YJM1]